MRHLRNKTARRGNVVAFTAVAMVPVLGFVAIALDGGRMILERRNAQAAADAAALAAANDLLVNFVTNNGKDPNGTAVKSGRTTAKADGYDNDADAVANTVIINVNPSNYQGGPNKGAQIPPGYAEAIISVNLPRTFSAVFGSGTLPIGGRAVARGNLVGFGDGIILLNRTAKGALTDTGNGSVNVTNANIVIDSNDPAAGVATGNGNVIANGFYITGTPGTSTSGSGRFIGNVSHGPPIPDPLAKLPEPDESTLTVRSTSTLQISDSAPHTLLPGVYKGGINISGQGAVTLQPGIYYFDGGGFRSTGQGSLTGMGVLLYNAPVNTGDVVAITGQGSVNITPPTSGTYQGISLFQDRTSTAPVSVTGNGSFNVNYKPSDVAQIMVAGLVE